MVCGNRSLIVSHKSEGFDEYKGLDWTSHLVLPESAMFERSLLNEDYGISPQELMNSKLIPDTNKQTYREIQRNKGDIQLSPHSLAGHCSRQTFRKHSFAA